jgi:hypothetical protein
MKKCLSLIGLICKNVLIRATIIAVKREFYFVAAFVDWNTRIQYAVR